MSDRKPSPEERAARLEALLDDIQDAPAESHETEDASSPDLDELDAAWGEDEGEDRERTVIGAVPDLVAQTRPDAVEARAVAVQKAPKPVRERIDPQVLAERADRRRDKARAKAEAARARKRAKADVAAQRQKQKQPRGKRPPDVASKKTRESPTEATSGPEADARPMRNIPTRRRGRDVVRMALLVSVVVIAGGALLFLLRR